MTLQRLGDEDEKCLVPRDEYEEPREADDEVDLPRLEEEDDEAVLLPSFLEERFDSREL